MDKKECYVVDKAQRIDRFLTTQLQQSRSQISTLIKKGAVEVDGSVVTKNGYALKDGQKITVTFPMLQESQSFDVDFDVEILYEDDDLMVLNKPSGVTTHPAPSVKEATLVDWLKQKGVRLAPGQIMRHRGDALPCFFGNIPHQRMQTFFQWPATRGGCVICVAVIFICLVCL